MAKLLDVKMLGSNVKKMYGMLDYLKEGEEDIHQIACLVSMENILNVFEDTVSVIVENDEIEASEKIEMLKDMADQLDSMYNDLVEVYIIVRSKREGGDQIVTKS